MVVLDRRAVLRTGAATALAGAGAALPAGPASAAAVGSAAGSPGVVKPRSAVQPENLDARGWRQLADSVRGPLFRQQDANFWALSVPENHRFAQIIPAGILCPDTPADVARAISWASENQLPVTPRGGGHSYAGFSSTTGLLLSLARMRQVRVDTAAGTVTVQGGARNADVLAALGGTDLLLPGGRCATVGVGGLTLGGGIGFATRPYGLSCDSLISTVVATADGRLATCDENTNADLFWACRGGAGGNFGVNTSFTFRLHPVPGATVYNFAWDRRYAATVLKEFSDLTAEPAYSRTLGAQYGIHTGAEPTVYGQGLYYGDRTELEGILRPLLLAAPPATQFIEERKIWPAMGYFYATPSGNPYGTKSIVTPKLLTNDIIDRLVARIDAFPAGSPASSASVSFFAMGGADTAVKPGDTAYVHRDAHFIMSLTAYWGDTDFTEVRDTNLAWLDTLYQEMSADLGTSAYQNFPDGELKQWWTAYYGANYDRLVQVKQKYDPELLFRYPQAVRPDPRS